MAPQQKQEHRVQPQGILDKPISDFFESLSHTLRQAYNSVFTPPVRLPKLQGYISVTWAPTGETLVTQCDRAMG